MPLVGPSAEIGHAGTTLIRWSDLFASSEVTPELKWPRSISVFENMRNDSHLEALLYALMIPIIRGEWSIDPNGARPEAVELLAEDLGLPIQGEKADNIKTREMDGDDDDDPRFSHSQNLYLAIDTALTYGHAYFEQVGEIVDGRWRLKNLAMREPQSIRRIGIKTETNRLDYIEQLTPFYPSDHKRIPANRLVHFLWEERPGNWVGRSMFRSTYRNWLLKDRLLRIDVINHEKAGGVPIVTAPEDATDREIEQLAEFAQAIRVGEDAGGALPEGAQLQTLKPSAGGSNPALQSIRYHDEQMSRRFLATFLELAGAQRGSRALGESLIDWFKLAPGVYSGLVHGRDERPRDC